MTAGTTGSFDESRQVLPFLAPLSESLIAYSFPQHWENEITNWKPTFSASRGSEMVNQIWQSYLAKVREARQDITDKMDTLVQLDAAQPPRKRTLSPTWFRQELADLAPSSRAALPTRSPKRSPVSADTISEYISGNVLRKSESYGFYEPQSMAALLICREVDQQRERKWLPDAVPEHEPWYWVWSQERPGAPLIPVPYPQVPINLPPSTVLFTRWVGASWDEEAWLRLGYLGAITFVGLLYDRRNRTQTFSPHDLEVWERGISKVVAQEQAALFPPASPSLDFESLDSQESPFDASLELDLALHLLGQFKHSGLLRAEVSHVPGIRGGRGQAHIQLQNGNVLRSYVVDKGGLTHPVKLETLLNLDARRGRFEWVFQPQSILHPPSGPAWTGPVASVSPEVMRKYTTNALKRLAAQFFSTSNLHHI